MSTAAVVLPGTSRPANRNAERLHDADPSTRVEVTITLRGPDLPNASNMPKAAMTREALAAQYGASQADADTVAKTLKGFGMAVEEVSLASRSMRVSGTVAQMEAAFQPQLSIYHTASQGDFRGRTGDLKVPADLSGIVTGIFGLDQRRVARRKSTITTQAPVQAAKKTTAPKPLGPADFEARYSFPPGTGQGQQIAIAEFDGGYFPDDLVAYCTKFGLPVPQVTTVPVGKTPLTLDEIRQLPPQQRQDELGATTEVMMDVQVIAGLCPQAEIFVYFATFDQKGWVDLLNAVIAGKPASPVSLSISWGLAEDDPDWSTAARNNINDRLQAVALLGIAVCVSSGDDGSGDELTDGRCHVDFPSSSPFVLSVGGTMLTGSGSNVIEEAWWQTPGRRTGNGRSGATGGGVSVFFNRPQWQDVHVASKNPGSIDGRVIPDVSALSGPPFYDLILLGGDAPNGGTSASAPLWAALIARINANLAPDKRQRFLTPLLYQEVNGTTVGQAGCSDVTIGKNVSNPKPGVGYDAGPGFDPVTGWGTPNGKALLGALQ